MSTPNVPIYIDQGGATLHIDAGGTLKIAGTTLTHATDPAALALTASGTYQQAELQSVADKLDALMAALRAAGLLV